MPRCLRYAATVVFVAVGCAGREAAAQSSEPIVTARPSFTETPLVVAPKVVQFETGVLWGTEAAAGLTSKELSAPNLLLRLGMTERLELRVGMQGLVRDRIDRSGRPNADWRTSASNTAVGVKYQIAHQEGLGLDLAVVAVVSIPTGGGTSSGNADPSVTLAWGRTLGRASVTGNVNWSAPTAPDDERERVLDGSLSVGHPLWGSWGAFWEAVVTTVDDSDAPSAWTGNAGITRLVGNNVKLDVHLGLGLNDTAQDWALGAGVSYRFRR